MRLSNDYYLDFFIDFTEYFWTRAGVFDLAGDLGDSINCGADAINL